MPDGTELRFYTEHGAKLSDEAGLAVESGMGSPVQIFEAGDVVPDYVLKAPAGLSIRRASMTVQDPTRLSELLQPNMGVCHWAACRTVRR